MIYSNYDELMIDVEMIAIYNKEISRAVIQKKRLQNQQRQAYLQNITGSAPEKANTPLAVVTIKFDNGEEWDVLDPERWLDVYRLTRRAYRFFFAEAVPEALDWYYEKGKTATQAYSRGGVTRTKFFEQRRKFIWLMSQYAGQRGLITLAEEFSEDEEPACND